MYPELASTPERQNIAGMITHTDAMVGDIVQALNSTGLYDNTIIIFSSDNGGPGGQEEVPSPERFDSHIIDRNWPFRGQKHEVYEGGVRVAGFVHSPLLPNKAKGTSVQGMVHITDWLPTILAATGVTTTDALKPFQWDGINLWPCILGDTSQCHRNEVVINLNTVCDTPDAPSSDFKTECPAPKAAIRIGDMKLLAECFDAASASLTGRVFLFNVTADPSESVDLSTAQPNTVKALGERLVFHGKEAAAIPPLSDTAPWQGHGYYCAKCTPGTPKGNKFGKKSWEVWCEGPPGTVC